MQTRITSALIYASNPSSPGAVAWWKPSCIEDAETCKAFKDYDWWLWQITCSDVSTYSRDLHAQPHGFLHRYSPCIGGKKAISNFFSWQSWVYSRCQSLRQFCLTSAAALLWNRMHDASTSLRQFWLTHADAFHFEIDKTRYQSSQRASKWELGGAMLEIPAPLRALLFHHPQHIQNIVSMAPRAKRRSLCEQQLDRILRAVVIGHNEPSTQNRSAAIDPTKAMKQNVHGLVFVDGNDWLLPQLEAYALPAGEAFPLQCFVPSKSRPGCFNVMSSNWQWIWTTSCSLK